MLQKQILLIFFSLCTLSIIDSIAQINTLIFEPEPIRSFNTNGPATAITSGDFNGDGYEDIATANYTRSTVTILLNLIDGESLFFSDSIIFEVGWAPNTITSGDFDLDGRIDIITANAGDENLTILHNITNSGLLNFERINKYKTGKGPCSLLSVDLDQDGKLDLVFANYWSDFIQIFRNISDNGNINFEETEKKITTGYFIESIISEDFNGDGKPDLASVPLKLKVFTNNSSPGTIAFSQPDEFSILGSADYLISGDYNNDGKSEIGLITSSGELTFAENNSTITEMHFIHLWTNSFKVGPRVDYVTTCDINNDEKLDIITVSSIVLFAKARSHNCISVTLNKSTINSFNFEDYKRIEVAFDPICSTSSDFNNDGKIDLAIGSDDAWYVSILQNRSEKDKVNLNSVYRFPLESLPFEPKGGNPPWLDLIDGADFNGDDKIDLVTAFKSFGDNGIIILQNKSDVGFLKFDTAASYFTGLMPNSLVLTDFNNDLKQDIVVAVSDKHSSESEKSLTVFKNESTNSDFTFFKSSIDLNSYPVCIMKGDIDLDGKIDLVVGGVQPTSLYVFRNISSSTGIDFELSWVYEHPTHLSMTSIKLADFDKDGRLDISVCDSNVYLFYNKSEPGKVSIEYYDEKITNISGGPMAVADVDSDDLVDLLILGRRASENGCFIFKNESKIGTLQFADPVNFAIFRRAALIKVYALTGENGTDIIIGNQYLQYKIFENTSNSNSISFSPIFPGYLILGSLELFISDFDGDGFKDMASISSDQFEILILRTISDSPTSTREEFFSAPKYYRLCQNYPNPFNSSTAIQYQLPEPGKVSVRIYDILGREVKTLTNKYFYAGTYKLIWDGTDNHNEKVGSGVYFFRMETIKYVKVRKAILLN